MTNIKLGSARPYGEKRKGTSTTCYLHELTIGARRAPKKIIPDTIEKLVR